jgi:N6-adenosine-specific RNA methylase IME4
VEGELIGKNDKVQQGREAWSRIKESGKKLREDWLILARALDVGRQKFITDEGGLNKKYFGQWCDAEGFSDLEGADRSNALWVLDNYQSILGLSQIKENNPTGIRKAVRKLEKKEEKEAEIQAQAEAIATGDLPVLENKYHVIVLDPPWPYEDGKANTYDAEARRVANPYPEQSIEEISNMDIPAADDCVMWLWTTHKFMHNALDLLIHWGFDHKAILVWDKEKIGMGHWLRMQCEFCLLAVKGNPIWDNTEVRDILREPRREHSRKPEAFYEMVENICHGAKFEFYARQQRDGWDSLQVGIETEKFND